MATESEVKGRTENSYAEWWNFTSLTISYLHSYRLFPVSTKIIIVTTFAYLEQNCMQFKDLSLKVLNMIYS